MCVYKITTKRSYICTYIQNNKKKILENKREVEIKKVAKAYCCVNVLF